MTVRNFFSRYNILQSIISWEIDPAIHINCLWIPPDQLAEHPNCSPVWVCIPPPVTFVIVTALQSAISQFLCSSECTQDRQASRSEFACWLLDWTLNDIKPHDCLVIASNMTDFTFTYYWLNHSNEDAYFMTETAAVFTYIWIILKLLKAVAWMSKN